MEPIGQTTSATTGNFALVIPPQGFGEMFKRAIFTKDEIHSMCADSRGRYVIYVGNKGIKNPPPALPGAYLVIQDIWAYIIHAITDRKAQLLKSVEQSKM